MLNKVACFGLLLFSCSTYAEGWLDDATKYEYRGWACDPATPNYQGWLHIYKGSQYIGALQANQPRESAVAELCGNDSGAHGFNGSISFPYEVLDNQWHEVHLYFLKQDGGVFEINGSPRGVHFDGGAPPPPPPPPATQPWSCVGYPIQPGWFIVGTEARMHTCGDGSSVLNNNVFLLENSAGKSGMTVCKQTLPINWFVSETQTNFGGCNNNNNTVKSYDNVLSIINSDYFGSLDVCTRYGRLPDGWVFVRSYTRYGSCGSGAMASDNRMVIRKNS